MQRVHRSDWVRVELCLLHSRCCDDKNDVFASVLMLHTVMKANLTEVWMLQAL